MAAAERLLRLAQSKFQEALETQTRNPDVLCNLGLVTMRLLECTTDWRSLDFERDPVLAQIESYFLRAESECAPEMQSIRSKVIFLNERGFVFYIFLCKGLFELWKLFGKCSTLQRSRTVLLEGN